MLFYSIQNHLFQSLGFCSYRIFWFVLIQKKQLEEQIEDLEFRLKGLIIHNPLLQKVEQDTLASMVKDSKEDSDGEL